MSPKSKPAACIDPDVSPSESDSDEGGQFYAMHFGANGETLMRQGMGYPSPQAMMIAQALQGFVEKRIAQRGAEGDQALTTSPCAASGSNDGAGVLMFGNSDFTSTTAGNATSFVGDSAHQVIHDANDDHDENTLATQQDAKQQVAHEAKKRHSKKGGNKKKKNAKK